MPKEIQWWPNYLYHYSDVNHAASIIGSEFIYDRANAMAHQLTTTDAASQNVLDVTSDAVKHCGRLYMRPLTPPQYYSEGYKPELVRHKNYKDVNCPVPVFFLFDAAKTLAYPGVHFIECGAAGFNVQKWRSGPDAFANLHFDKIFHNGSTGSNTNILKYRRSEVLREGGIPLQGLLRRIVCRTPAEMQTLLSLLQQRCPKQYEPYKKLITFATADVGLYLFYGHGIYVKSIRANDDTLLIEFNEARLRYDYNTTRKTPVSINAKIIVDCKNDFGQTFARYTYYNDRLSYREHNGISLRLPQEQCSSYFVELRLDDNLVFQGDISVNTQDIL